MRFHVLRKVICIFLIIAYMISSAYSYNIVKAGGLSTIVQEFYSDQWRVAGEFGYTWSFINIPWIGRQTLEYSVGLPGNGRVYGAEVPYNDDLVVNNKFAFWGVELRNTDKDEYWTKDLSSCVNTAVLSVKVRIDDPQFANICYIALGDYADGYNFVGIRLNKYYSPDDCRTFKTIHIPLSEFADITSDDRYQVAAKGTSRGINFSKVTFAGLLCRPSADTPRGNYQTYMDDLYILNVLAPENFGVEYSDDVSVTLSWDASKSDVSVYELFKDGVKIATLPSDVLSYTDDGLETKKTYKYKLRAIDRFGASSIFTDEINVFTSPIGMPQDVKAISAFEDALKVQITWNPPRYGNVDKYVIYRNNEKLAELDKDQLSYMDTDNLTNDQYYTYYVECVSTDGDISMPSRVVRILATIIAAPTGLTANYSVEDKIITLNWESVSSAVKYEVVCNGEIIATVSETQYIHIGEYHKIYKYFVRALNSKNIKSQPSNEVVVYMSDPEIITAQSIFSDDVDSSYSIIPVGKANRLINTEIVRNGAASCNIVFEPRDFDEQRIDFSRKTGTMNLAAQRVAGGALAFSVYASSGNDIQNVNVGFAYEITFSSKPYMLKSKVCLSDYVTEFGKWQYVVIPLSDFPDIGEFRYLNQYISANFDFSKVQRITFYVDNNTDILTPQNIYIDDFALIAYQAPSVHHVSLPDGTVLAQNSIIDNDIAELYIKFDYAILPESVNANNIKILENDVEIDTYVTYDRATKTCKVVLLTPLSANENYQISISGLKSDRGITMADFNLDFRIKDTGAVPQTPDLTRPLLSMSSCNVIVGQAANTDLMIAPDNRMNSYICGLNLNITYDSSVVLIRHVELCDELKNGGAEIDFSKENAVTIKLPVNPNNKWLPKGRLATLRFEAVNSGKSNLAVNGTFTVCSSSDGIFNVDIQQQGVSGITVTKVDNEQGSKYAGGGRGAGKITPVITVPVITPDENSDDTGVYPAAKLSDMDEAEWAKEGIQYLYEKGYVSGYPDNTFRPNKNITREEFVVILVKSFGFTEEGAETTFKDVSKNDWFHDYVAIAEKKGIIQGYDNYFGVGQEITREDMCVIILRAAGIAGISLEEKNDAVIYADISEASDYAVESITKLQRAGIINGMGENMFVPKGIVSRAMTAKVIYEIIKLNE